MSDSAAPLGKSRPAATNLYQLAAVVGVCFSFAAGLTAQAGDILRGGAPAGALPGSRPIGGARGVNAARTSANSGDALARTTQAIQAVKAMQNAARQLANRGPTNLGGNPNVPGVRLPSVPNGLAVGGLKVSPNVPSTLPTGGIPGLWSGAKLPTQSQVGKETIVTIKQEASKALLTWETFNIGKETTLKFDQSAGGKDKNKWIAFNKVEDPTGVPSQILGSIEAGGQVYVINRNGIIFGGSSQVNTRGFVASTLPINDNLLGQGLLNNPDAQFLFSALPVAGGSDGTPAFIPTISDPKFQLALGANAYLLAEALAVDASNNALRAPVFVVNNSDGSKTTLVASTDYALSIDPTTKKATATFTPSGLAKVGEAPVNVVYAPAEVKSGDITVKPGAVMRTPVSADGNGGRVMLVGANVTNGGTISTPAGQTILAAGQQVGIAAHASDDPSLRGLDVWVGAAGNGTGIVTNKGLVQSMTGSVSMHGRSVNQLGVIESSTSVNLNGRIDLRASYGAVANPNFDLIGGSSGGSGPMFLYQHTGALKFGENSVTRILPDYLSDDMVPGLSLPEKSQINAEGHAVYFGPNALMFAPNADVSIRAGDWPFVDSNGDRTIFGSDGNVEPGLAKNYIGTTQKFLFSSGQIYLDSSSMINVAGSTNVFVPLAQSILDVEFRGAEFADSPVQRDGILQAAALTLDIRQSGIYGGRYWMGTPLGDATGLAGLIQRNVAQLTADGGHVTMQAGESIVVQKGATIDVSGGYYQNEGGIVKTSRLIQFGRLVDVADALPSEIYEGIYTGQYITASARWGVTESFAAPWMTGAHFEEGYITGANGGALDLTAPSMAIDGKLLGLTVEGPRQRSDAPDHSALTIAFKAERIDPLLIESFLTISPTPPTVTFQANTSQPAVAPFALNDAGEPVPLREERVETFLLSPNVLGANGFGQLAIENPNGDINVPKGVHVAAPAYGSLALEGSNITILGQVTAASGTLNFTARNVSLEVAQLFPVQQAQDPGLALPVPNAGRGLFTLGAGARLSTAGLIANDLPGSEDPFSQPLAIDGGKITIDAYNAKLASGSSINVSGGLAVSSRGELRYGDGGDIAVRAGRDPGLTSVIGGGLALNATLAGYSGATGGTLALQTSVIQVGGKTSDRSTLLLTPDFFRHGGFTSYSLTGIGAEDGVPGVTIAPGTFIRPVAENLRAIPQDGSQEFDLQIALNQIGYRSPVSLSFNALGFDNLSTQAEVDIIGNVLMSEGARIVTDPGASVSFKGQTISFFGSVSAPGGTISLAGASRYPIPPNVIPEVPKATVYIGPEARLSTAGTAVIVPDEFGRRLGRLYPGGTISVSGNIIAEVGSILDVSGGSAVFDIHPSLLGEMETPVVPITSGLTSPLWALQSIPTRIDSNGGLLDLTGSEMLFADSTLLGRAGGVTAHGGTLSVASNRFVSGEVTSADINLLVIASGRTIGSNNTDLGVGSTVVDSAGNALPGMGYFAASRFENGGFDSLDLGYKTFDVTPVKIGGNVQFSGPVSISARGALRVGAGGIIEANGPVNLSAGYIALGQEFRPPENPDDPAINPFLGPTGSVFPVAPTYGVGSLTVRAKTIDVGTTSLQGIGKAKLIADGGDIRGNGTINIAGDLTLKAAQVYPTTLSTFDIFAYDHAGVAGSVTIIGSGHAATPMSAGGKLNIFASKIVQGGVLRAPMGSITLGWDGTDFDLTDPDLDSPFDPVARGSVPVPISDQVILKSGSLTSVSAVGMLVPFGLSTDGSTWIDPSGVNVTVGGLPDKEVIISGDSVTKQRGSTVDIRGGGELYAFRWIPGPGGSSDILGAATATWNAGAEYQAGDLVKFGGHIWTARVRHSGESPTIGLFWSMIPESYAVLPGYQSIVAPYAPFNSGDNASALGGEAGYVSSSLHVGDRIYLEGIPGLNTGAYTLLPSRYALLPGAFLVSPTGNDSIGAFALPDGASLTSGIAFNQFSRSQLVSPVREQYEVAPYDVVHNRVDFDNYLGNSFFTEAAARLNVKQRQDLPMDGGHLALHGNSDLQVAGQVLTGHGAAARGAAVDLSSFADIEVVGGSGPTSSGAVVVLNTAVLNSWHADSLLIGGIRRDISAGTSIEVRANDLELSNAGSTLKGNDIVLAAKADLTIGDGAAMMSVGRSKGAATLLLSGDGALVRVSSDPGAATVRTNRTQTPAVTPLLTVGADAQLGGGSVILDSTHLTDLDSSAGLNTQALTLGSGQIAIQLPGSGVDLSSTQQLVLGGQVLQDVQQVRSVTLTSYSTIDIYGTGQFGSDSLRNLTLQSAGIVRGNDAATGDVVFHGDNILFANPSNVSQSTVAPGTLPGSLQFDANIIRFGANTFSIGGYEDVVLNATGGVLAQGKATGANQVPAFKVAGNLTMIAPVITGKGGTSQQITAGGSLVIEQATSNAAVSGGLGANLTFTGADVIANADVVLPSGQIAMRATSGDVTIGGMLDVSGTKKEFYDVIRYSSAGNITLTSDLGDVTIASGSSVSVKALAGADNDVTGNAGTLTVNAGKGVFSLAADATLSGQATAGKASGSFILDAGSLPDFTELASVLNNGGFFERRNLRVRSGDVTIDGANIARNFVVSADTGDIHVTGSIDASGKTGGKIALVAGGNLVVEAGSQLTVHADKFSSSGKGGEVQLEAGAAVNGVANLAATLDLQVGSSIDLGVDAFKPGGISTPGSSAFNGQFSGTLHLRAPRTANNTDVAVSTIGSTITNASSIVVEGYEIVDLTGSGGLITGGRTNISSLPAANTVQGAVYASANSFLSGANYDAMMQRLLGSDSQGLTSSLVLAPGVEIINQTGDLTLGAAGSTSLAGDWNLSDFRFGPKSAPGVLTLRAAGDIVFNNSLSDGFTPIAPASTNGNSMLWLAQMSPLNTNLSVNTQSWSYRLTAGSDLSAADVHAVSPIEALGAGKGSLLVGEFYAAIPSNNPSAIGVNGTTANSIGISGGGTRYEVIRTGTGDIDIAAARDVQLRNQFATIYTAGVRLPNPTTIFAANDFTAPVIPQNHPTQSPLGAIQQLHVPQWSMAGGDVTIAAEGDVRRVTLLNGVVVDDSSRQLPSNWLYRRGYVDPATGLFGEVRVNPVGLGSPVIDPAASTTWWIDFTNFFEGVGALGGGDVTLLAAHDVINVDAFIPTNARMASRGADGLPIKPNGNNLLELGGGDLNVRAGNNIDGGVYYFERGNGSLFAGGEITTNESRSPSLGILGSTALPPEIVQSNTPSIYDPKTWLPTTLFVGKSTFDVSARGDVLLGPVTNPFFLPQGINNKYWYKTYFNTYSEDAGATVSSFGGSVTHRLAATLPNQNTPKPILQAWLEQQNYFVESTNTSGAANYQPWLRLSERYIEPFESMLSVSAPNLSSTAFAGDINIVGSSTLFPSPTGGIALAASGSIVGLQPTGRTSAGSNNVPVTTWTSATINVSDANPSLIPGVSSPLAFIQIVPTRASGVLVNPAQTVNAEVFRPISLFFNETGSYSGFSANSKVQQALHTDGLLHLADDEPVRIYANKGDITGLTLFAPKAAQIAANRDIIDVAFYIQHVGNEDISFVSAGRDIVPYNENASLRSVANDLAAGNLVVGAQTIGLAGDLQINGPGVLEVLAGRNVDLGTGQNLPDGTGFGITSVGNARNPYLPFEGADLVVMAGVSAAGGRGAATGLSKSSLDFDTFIDDYRSDIRSLDSAYLAKIGTKAKFDNLSAEQQALVALEAFYGVLRNAGRTVSQDGATAPDSSSSDAAATASENSDAAGTGATATTGYESGFAAIDTLFGKGNGSGEIFTQSREIRTRTGGAISLGAPKGGVTMASDIFGNPLTPPGVVTEFGGPVSVFTDQSVDIGQARIFTLRGGDIIIWSSNGDIAAGNAPKTVVTAPPTRVVIDVNSAAVQTDLGGLATGGGIGVLAAVEGVPPGNVDLIAPNGAVDAGDAGIRVTGNLNIAATTVLNAGNIQSGGTSSGVPVAAPVAAPNLGALAASSSATGAAANAANQVAQSRKDDDDEKKEESASIILLEVIGYGGGEG